MKELRSPIIIAGPCAAESMEQIETSIDQANAHGISIMRASIVKPRTENSWDGIGSEQGIPMLKRIHDAGIIPATEVLDIEEAKELIEGVLGHDEGEMVLWIGARNQNHRFQRNLGRLGAEDPRVIIGAKNQSWPGEAEKHFRGIISHIADAGGYDRSKLLMIHRGFSVNNSYGYRNSPDYDMALRIKEEEEVLMLLDPSHIGGSKEKVIEVAEEGMSFSRNGIIFDGMMIEVHPNVSQAITDKKQQLTWEEFDSHILPVLKGESKVLVSAAD